jgi:hypothetical protein
MARAWVARGYKRGNLRAGGWGAAVHEAATDISVPETMSFDLLYVETVLLSLPFFLHTGWHGPERLKTVIERRPFQKLAGDERSWLKAKHHISFADGPGAFNRSWGPLRAWNDDEIAPNSGFPLHAHANVEIITYVREGAVTHSDSLGNEGRTKAGDVQVMSAGAGIRHAEYNLERGPTRIFQIWIAPDRIGGSPAWGTKGFPKADRSGRFARLTSGTT